MDAYERLRSDATRAQGRMLRGFGILIREGMAAWMRAVAAAAPAAAATTSMATAIAAPFPLPVGAEREVIEVLANMALFTVEEART